MKLAPVPLAFALHPALAVELAGQSARTTHGAQEAVDAARYLAGLLIGALQGVGIDRLLHQGVYEPAPGIWDAAPLHPKVAAVAAGSFLTKEPPAIKGGGYVVDALEAALWAVARSRTFSDGALLAVNLGDDADTTGAIYGQLAGALYGSAAIPDEWRSALVRPDELVAMADALWSLTGSVDTTAVQPAAPPPPGDSYWVVEGDLLAGPYPGAKSLAEARKKLEAFSITPSRWSVEASNRVASGSVDRLSSELTDFPAECRLTRPILRRAAELRIGSIVAPGPWPDG